MIYPLPEKSGLGIHATLDINGVVRFGPDVEWVEELDYSVNMERLPLFLSEISKYYPAIYSREIVPEFVGIRPKTKPENEQPQDFTIQSEEDHHQKGLINLYGIESPGLTSSMAIAEEVFSRMRV